MSTSDAHRVLLEWSVQYEAHRMLSKHRFANYYRLLALQLGGRRWPFSGNEVIDLSAAAAAAAAIAATAPIVVAVIAIAVVVAVAA
ncbi:hypothetical protein AAE478_004572 [Parahypoxylon ruwenzoriense]